MIEIPTDRSMGDYAFPCFRLAKQLRKAPQIIAAELADDMGDSALIESSIAVNAYVNFMLKRENFINPFQETPGPVVVGAGPRTSFCSLPGEVRHPGGI